MTAAEKRAEARRLRAEGRTNTEIAAMLGYAHPSGVSHLLNPEINQRDNARRADAKRSWGNEHDRGLCPCGNVMAVGARCRGFVMCRECRDEVVAVGTAMRRERIADMWQQGCTLREIAAALDSTAATIGGDMARMRRTGWDLPRRHNWSAEGLARAQAARRAA